MSWNIVCSGDRAEVIELVEQAPFHGEEDELPLFILAKRLCLERLVTLERGCNVCIINNMGDLTITVSGVPKPRPVETT